MGTGETLIQQTYERFLKVCPKENIYIVTNELYHDLTRKQLPDLTDEQIILEPSRRNTAPCIAYAAYKIYKKNPEANLVVAPSDHIILKEEAFTQTILGALEAAEGNDWLITLGIKPSRPDTGYGYIQFNHEAVDTKFGSLKKVKTFTEKPNLELAETFLASGDFLWNSGIFIWTVQSILKAMEAHIPEVNSLFKDGLSKYNTAAESEFIKETYAVCKSISIDYGVMEKASNVYVFISDFGWSDLGTWGSLHEIRSQDNHGNAITGKQVMLYDTHNCVIHMPKDKLVVLEGLDDYIVVEDENVLLVCRKKDEQHIRQIVNDVRIEKGEKFV